MSYEDRIRLLNRLPFLQRTSDGLLIQVTGAVDALTAQELDTLKEVGPSLLVKSAEPDSRDLLINAQIFPVR
jgi:hypothetical protein